MNPRPDARLARLGSLRAEERGGVLQQVSLDEAATISPERTAELMALEDALQQLEPFDPRKSQVVELRYFGDLSYEELGATLNLNVKTVSSRLSKCLDRLEEIARRIFSRETPDVFPSNP